MKRLCTIALVFIFFFSACGGGEQTIEGEQDMLQALLDITNARRAGIIKPSDERLNALTTGRAARSEDDIMQMLTQTELIDTVSMAEAHEDARVFLTALQQMYGAYIYFGGDDVFIPLFDEIAEIISTAEQWKTQDLMTLIQDKISDIILDNHFFFGDRMMGVNADFYIGETAFDLTDSGFINRANELLITSTDGYHVNDIFRLTMDNQGAFYYIPVIPVLGNEETGHITVTVHYENGEQEMLRLNKQVTQRQDFEETSLRYENGIPVVTARIMGFDLTTGISEEETLRFLAIAEQIKDEPTVIIDMRSNYGGCGILPAKWFEIVLSAFVPTNFFHLNALNYDMFIQAIRADTGDRFLNQRAMDFIQYLSPVPHNALHTIYYSDPDNFIETDKLLILLTDRYTMSSAEMFTDMMLNIQNTVIIGHNTSGTLHTEAGAAVLRLPHSGIPFSFGGGIFIHPESENQIENRIEGVGIAPDIWVDFDALEAAFILLDANN